MNSEILSIRTATKLVKYDKAIEHINNRILILQTQLKQTQKNSYNELKLIFAIKELESIKEIFEINEQ